MPGAGVSIPFTYAHYLRASRQRHAISIASRPASRSFSQLSRLHKPQTSPEVEVKEAQSSIKEKILDQSPRTSPLSQDGEAEQGAMSRRLAEATENAILEGGRAGRRAFEEAGFSEELKQKLLERVGVQKFRAENAAASAEGAMSSKVGKGSRAIATAPAWTGTEVVEDTVLRMLDDARKPLKPDLRGPANIPSPVVDLRLREVRKRPGQRLANARDKTSIYALSKDTQMSEKEREALRKELKERFTPGARSMPNSIQGLAALANERIEDAIARGQFKNIPRGKAIERDPRADNPFINTTEYIMNKMIQRQDIVPPWIEKQQQLVKAVRVFRSRLRSDWKRHAARTIASQGGTLQEQMRQAERYAEAERVHNPKKRSEEQISASANTTDFKTMQATSRANLTYNFLPAQILLETKDAGATTSDPTLTAEQPEPISNTSEEPPSQRPRPLPAPFRIPEWETAELSYLQLAVTNLNSLTRSYNLMAPDLVKKSYFSLERELKSCYADVAPQLSETLKERAARPTKEFVEKIGHKPGGVLEKFATDKAAIYDSKKPLYGFKEFWNDLFGEKRS